LEIDPSNAKAYNNLAVTYFNIGQYNLAVKHCKKAIDLGYKAERKFLEQLGLHK